MLALMIRASHRESVRTSAFQADFRDGDSVIGYLLISGRYEILNYCLYVGNLVLKEVVISLSPTQEELEMKTLIHKPFGLLLLVSTLLGSIGLTTAAWADPGPGMMYGGGRHMGMHGGQDGCGPSWKDTLTDEQRAALAKLKLDYLKVKAPIKAKIKNLKVELALLVTTDKPDTNAINKKIDELTKLKNDKLKEKYKYIAAKRKVLNAEQQVLFDMRVMQKAMHGKGKGQCVH